MRIFRASTNDEAKVFTAWVAVQDYEGATDALKLLLNPLTSDHSDLDWDESGIEEESYTQILSITAD